METKFEAKWRFGVLRIDFVSKLPNLSLTQYLPRFKQVHHFLKSEIFHTIHLFYLTIPSGSQIHRNTLQIPDDTAQLSCQGTILTENCPQNGSHFGRWGGVVSSPFPRWCPMVPKGYQNGVKMLKKVSKLLIIF